MNLNRSVRPYLVASLCVFACMVAVFTGFDLQVLAQAQPSDDSMPLTLVYTLFWLLGLVAGDMYLFRAALTVARAQGQPGAQPLSWGNKALFLAAFLLTNSFIGRSIAAHIAGWIHR